jgi:hypothetical protein
MAVRDVEFVSRRFVILLSFSIVFALVLTGIVAFWLPRRIFIRAFDPTLCTIVASQPGCSLECRVVNVSSPAFPNGMNGSVTLNGPDRRACRSEITCNEAFRCRFRVVNASGVVKLTVRKDVPRVAPGLLLYTGLAALVVAFLAAWLFVDWFRHSTLVDAGAVYAIVFVPPGPDLSLISEAIHSRWPVLEARELDFSAAVEHVNPASLIVEAQQKLCAPCAPSKRGVIFIARANGRNDVHVLEAVPKDFYRICLLVERGVCFCSSQHGRMNTSCDSFTCQVHGGESKVASVADKLSTTPPMVAECTTWENPCRISISEDESTLGNDDTVQNELIRLADVDDNFDFVYENHGTGTGGYKRLALRALSPVVGKRVAVISFFLRLKRHALSTGSKIWHASFLPCRLRRGDN